MRTIASASTEYIRVEVTTDSDPTGATPQFALTTSSDEPVSWTDGEWATSPVLVGSYYSTVARILVGAAGDITPAAGQYVVWTKVAAIPETVIDVSGYLKVT